MTRNIGLKNSVLSESLMLIKKCVLTITILSIKFEFPAHKSKQLSDKKLPTYCLNNKHKINPDELQFS